MKKIKAADIIIMAAALTVIFIFSAFSRKSSSGRKQVLIEGSRDDFLYSMDEDRTIYAGGPIGDTVIVIKDNSVHVADSPCRDKLCVSYGILSEIGEWTACLPNRIFISIQGSEEKEHETDDVAY